MTLIESSAKNILPFELTRSTNRVDSHHFSLASFFECCFLADQNYKIHAYNKFNMDVENITMENDIVYYMFCETRSRKRVNVE